MDPKEDNKDNKLPQPPPPLKDDEGNDLPVEIGIEADVEKDSTEISVTVTIPL